MEVLTVGQTKFALENNDGPIPHYLFAILYTKQL